MLPRNDPKDERGVGRMCRMTRVPEDKTGDGSLLINSATISMNMVSSTPDIRPAERGEDLQNLQAINPAESEVIHISATAKGAMALKGSFVPSIIIAEIKARESIPAKAKATEIIENFKKSGRKLPLEELRL